MRYGSVCAGIEAATVAWHPLGWQAAWYSEIEPFPCAVLKHHYPAVPNYGDMTKYEEWPDEPINLLVGGTPCQSFSVAGLRKGLADPRGNLMLTFGAIARRYRPEWLVWENVPGVLSSNGGRDFGTFLGMLAELGYGFAYRVLDAQYFGVPQRRKRVFVCAVRGTGNWQRAAAVLFESHSLQGHFAPSRETRESTARSITHGIGTGSDPDVMATLCAKDAEKWGCNQWVKEGKAVIQPVAKCLTSLQRLDPTVETLITSEVAETLIASDYKGPGHNRDHNFIAQPITFGAQMPEPQTDVDMVQTLQAKNPMAVAQPVATDLYNGAIDGEATHSLRVGNGNAMGGVPSVMSAMQVRRLTPVECERLQGFPDNYTNIPWRKKDKAPDGPRYRALGNSMAVPVMAWIGRRIKKVSEL